MRLWIAEKPSLAKAIFEALGGVPKKGKPYYQVGSEIVTWCYGHMLELCDPVDYDRKFEKWNISNLPLPLYWPPKLKIKKESEAQYKAISELIKKADCVVNAGDIDDEGQNLIDEILLYENYKGKTDRVLIADMNLSAIKKSINELQPNDKFKLMGECALVRSVSDQYFGYNLTQAYTLKAQEKGYRGVLNVGRVQTAVLGLINSRTLANKTHIKNHYYNVITKQGEFSAKYIPSNNDKVNENNKLIDAEQAKKIKDTIKGKPLTVSQIEKKEIVRPAPQAYNLSSLQQVCAKKWGYKAKETLDTVQSLYETHKILTYPRTDCRYLSDEHFNDAERIINAIKAFNLGFDDITNKTDLKLKHKTFNDKKITAHFAIIPTGHIINKSELSEKELNIFELICKSYISLFLKPSIRNSISIHLQNEGLVFHSSKQNRVFSGWEELFSGDIEQDDSSENNLYFETLSIGDSFIVEDVKIEQKETQPPRYFVESTLLSAMTRAAKEVDDPILKKALLDKDRNNSSEQGSIGTEATRASILEKIAMNTAIVEVVDEKGYKEKVYKTTELGQEFCALLPDEILKPNTSALWSMRQQEIKSGSISKDSFIEEMKDYVINQVGNIIKEGVNIKIEQHKCPECESGTLRRIKGSNGFFWGCSNYPECKSTFKDKSGKPLLKKDEVKKTVKRFKPKFKRIK